jgi:putative molybdopterin biosynthesis protein
VQKDKTNVYISNVDEEQAKKDYFEIIGEKYVESETIDVVESIGRVTFEAVYAKCSDPGYNAAAMDGIAVTAEYTYGVTEVNPKILEEGKDFQYINTGNVIHEPYNAVIMIEDVIQIGDGKIKIIAPAHPWQHIRPIGENIVAGEMIIPSKHKIRPLDIGALLSGGIEKIKVYKKPRVGIIPTGSELVENLESLAEGKLIESNSRVFAGLISEYGGEPNRYSSCEDDYEVLKRVIIQGVRENDILLVNAGSSAGTKDYTAKIIQELGQIIVHGVAIKPGKPTILGLIDQKPVIGIPGYPVSAYLVFETFVKPLILKYTGQNENLGEMVMATISKRLVSSLKSKELVRVTLGEVGDRLIATPLVRGAGAAMSLIKADGIFEIPKQSEGVEAGEEIQVKLLKPLKSIKGTLVSIGSHDLIMDIVADKMKLSSGHVGSMGGIMAMRRNECHISPIHLLDEDTGEYNTSYIQKYFAGRKMALIKGVKRLQGLIVQKGNPEHIKDFKDLTRENIRFINRQRGSGTRILLDYHCKKIGINVNDIKGYEREMTTHMTVSISIKTGTANVGMGIYSAARAMDLDFIPIAYEDYDFLVPYEYLEDEKMKSFIRILKSDDFRNNVLSLGGYALENTGEIQIVGDE